MMPQSVASSQLLVTSSPLLMLIGCLATMWDGSPSHDEGNPYTQVLLNLLDNARRHTPSGGTITLGAQSSDKLLSVWVSDTGTGIDPADLAHIFERFYRADRSRTGATGGSGLGLSIVKAIITAHGGTITAESEVGKGTRITFTLPLAPAPSPLPAKVPSQKL